MNSSVIIKNQRTGESVTFDGTVFALDTYYAGFTAATHTTYKGIGQVGVYLASSSIDERIIRLDGYIFSDKSSSQLSSLKRLMSRVVNPLDTFTVIKNNLTLECSASSIFFSNDTEFSCSFSIEAICHCPCYTGVSQSQTSYGSYDGKIIYPFALPEERIPLGVRNETGVMRVTNSGDIPSGFEIFVSGTRAFSGFRLENTGTHEYINLQYDFSAGETVRIDTRYGKKSAVSLLGGTERSIMNNIEFGSTFFSLDAGENVLAVTAGENPDVTVRIVFSPLYLGG